MRTAIVLTLCILVAGLALWFHGASTRPSPEPQPPAKQTDTSTTVAKSEQPQEKKETPVLEPVHVPHANPDTSVYIGGEYGEPKREVHTVMSKRMNGVIHQVMIRYKPQSISSDTLPGIKDIVESLAQRGETLAQYIQQVDEEVELLLDNLGQPLHSIICYRMYINMDGRVVAYDLSQTTGGEPQRFVGHLSRKGAIVDVYRGGENVDRNEVTFPHRDTFIMVELERIHQWYLCHPKELAKQEAVWLPLFYPHVMSFIDVAAKPLGDQIIAVGNANYECAHYLVETKSMQASEGLIARQEMWFDKQTQLLMKIQEIDPSIKAGEGPMTERSGIEVLKDLRPLMVVPPALPQKQFPYPLEHDLLYTVKAPAKGSPLGRSAPEDVSLGTVRLRFSKEGGNADEPYVASATVDLNGSGTMRHETARTSYNKDWEPVRYRADGEEQSDVKMQYSVSAHAAGGQLKVELNRHINESTAPRPELAPEPKHNDTATKDPLWPEGKDPLRRVKIDDSKEDENRPPPPRVTHQELNRPLTPGTYLFDFNRLEHLAALVYKFVLPKLPAKGETPETLYQKAGLFFVRQNRGGVLMFEITPELKPQVKGHKHGTPDDDGEGQLFMVSVANAMMPCSMLLAPDGRILELCMKYGSGEITYTLDDPIMRRRAERAQRETLKKGPMLLRPNWW